MLLRELWAQRSFRGLSFDEWYGTFQWDGGFQFVVNSSSTLSLLPGANLTGYRRLKRIMDATHPHYNVLVSWGGRA